MKFKSKKLVTLILMAIFFALPMNSILGAFKPALLSNNEFSVGILSSAYLEFQGIPRLFDYYIPSTFNDRRMPIMVVIHGSGYSSGMQLVDGDFVRIAEEEGFIVIGFNAVVVHNDNCPHATVVRENSQGVMQWLSSEGFNHDEIGVDTDNVRPVAFGWELVAAQGIDDVAYINTLVDLFINAGFGDAYRVFASGISHGAFMATRMAMEHPDRFIGAGSVAGGINTFLWQNNITPSHYGRHVFIHGDRDWIVPGGTLAEGNLNTWWDFTTFRFNSASVIAAINWLLIQQGLSPQQTDFAELPNSGIPETYPTRIERTEFNNGRAIMYWVENGGHTWPGGTQYMESWIVGPVSMQAQATNLIWDGIKVDIVSEDIAAQINQISSDANELTIRITTTYDNGRVVYIEETFTIENNISDVFQIDQFRVFAEIQDDAQIHEIRIVNTKVDSVAIEGEGFRAMFMGGHFNLNSSHSSTKCRYSKSNLVIKQSSHSSSK